MDYSHEIIYQIIKWQINDATIKIFLIILSSYIIKFIFEIVIKKFFDEKKEYNNCRNNIYTNQRFEIFTKLFNDLYEIETQLNVIEIENKEKLDDNIKCLSIKYIGSNSLLFNKKEIKIIKEIIDKIKVANTDYEFDYSYISIKKEELKKCLLK